MSQSDDLYERVKSMSSRRYRRMEWPAHGRWIQVRARTTGPKPMNAWGFNQDRETEYLDVNDPAWVEVEDWICPQCGHATQVPERHECESHARALYYWQHECSRLREALRAIARTEFASSDKLRVVASDSLRADQNANETEERRLREEEEQRRVQAEANATVQVQAELARRAKSDLSAFLVDVIGVPCEVAHLVTEAIIAGDVPHVRFEINEEVLHGS